jgi:hypothetical protein
VRVKNINRDTIISHYKGMPDLSDRVIGHSRDRYKFGSGTVSHKPQQIALERITYNQERFRQSKKESAGTMLRRIGEMKKAKPAQGISLTRPKPVSRIAPSPADRKQREPIRFDRRDIPEQKPEQQPKLSVPEQPKGEKIRAPRPSQPERRDQSQPVKIGVPEKPAQAERPRAPRYPAGTGISQPKHTERLKKPPPAKISPREEPTPPVRNTTPERARRLPQGTAVHEPGQKIGIDMPEPPQKYRGERPAPKYVPRERDIQQEPKRHQQTPGRAEPRTAPQREQRMSTPQQPEPSQQMRYRPPSAPAQRTQPSHR